MTALSRTFVDSISCGLKRTKVDRLSMSPITSVLAGDVQTPVVKLNQQKWIRCQCDILCLEYEKNVIFLLAS